MSLATRRKLGLASFWPTVLVIELTDIAFAVDSILAAIAMVGSPPPGHPAGAVHPKLWVVILGGLLGLMLMRVAAKLFIQLLDRFPRFEISAYLLVIIIGLKLLADWSVNSDWGSYPKWFERQMPAAARSLDNFERDRRAWVHDYEDWLRTKWPLGLKEHHAPPVNHADKPHGPPPAAKPGAEPLDHDPLHVPHLLDFHTWGRPEFIVFWSLMIICFGIGFLPSKKH
jgi:hypothetical protein